MLQALPDFVREYWRYLAAAAVVCGVLSYRSEKFFAYLKKGVLAAAILFALAAGYELLSGRSIVSLPARIDDKLSEEPSQAESGRRYYKSYEERYGNPPAK